MYILEVLSGPLDGKIWEFDREISIGRDESAVTACIPLDRYISRRHAYVCDDEGGLFVTDLASRNGVRVGRGAPAASPDAERAASREPLGLGEPFTVGHTVLRVVRG